MTHNNYEKVRHLDLKGATLKYDLYGMSPKKQDYVVIAQRRVILEGDKIQTLAYLVEAGWVYKKITPEERDKRKQREWMEEE